MVENLSNFEFEHLETVQNYTHLRKVGEYYLVEVIGQGAFGKVYLAMKNGQKYAIKELFIENRSGIEKVYKEIEILSELEHPNIINYTESFKKGNHIYIVMEYIEGVTLLEYMRLLRERVNSVSSRRRRYPRRSS